MHLHYQGTSVKSKMDKYFSIETLANNLENCLDKLFVSGFGSGSEAEIRELRELAAECERYGLLFGAITVENMADQWDQKRHSLDHDNSRLASSLCSLDLYLSSLKSKLQLDSLAAGMRF